MVYKVIVEKNDKGYSVSVPGLPGCWSEGSTEEEAIANIKAALSSYLKTVDELCKDKKIIEVEVNI